MNWRFNLLSLLGDQQWHTYYDLVSLGGIMKFWNEEEFRNHLHMALESDLLKSKKVTSRKHDLRDLSFQITKKGDTCFIELRNTLEGTKWYEYHKAKVKYYSKLQEQQQAATEFKKWKLKTGSTETFNYTI